MAADRNDPYGNYRFRLEIDGIVQAGFSEVTIPDSSCEATEYRVGSDPPNFRKLSGLTKYGALVLKWGITDSMELYEWRKRIEQGLIRLNRKNIAVILLDDDGSDKARWEFANAWPSKYDAPDMNAKGSEVAVESIEIAFETMERKS